MRSTACWSSIPPPWWKAIGWQMLAQSSRWAPSSAIRTYQAIGIVRGRKNGWLIRIFMREA